ncbi:hypothetical protein C1X05_02620 [Laceyella sacchari]|uniref:Proteasome lid subunit RPN8/RPN11, contains Jab1/MPN metalloenzyme (JAMM) motif n=1 Tax=Laceyella tengchongensis TaxID=574699 RepID=A0AA45WI74_9BACL|nr:Mov34/MPN/PAD-1 family protein [Laceyella tengchongensis]AUS07827.1 hypothetical protein C1X05_02620 [Laceyella sacchari]SMP00256.1 Proteasome lid subunit RPN8/RPN11, contains Jab1/MPN metalloenzyme (JAMM) motif [Laceyella tengchongensis]
MKPSYYSIRRHVIHGINAYCLEQYPYEGYGFLAGRDFTITHFFPIQSQNHRTCSWELEPRSYRDNIKQMRQLQLDWLGVVHSHPVTQAYPSARDLTGWHFHDKSLWIMSLKDKEFQLCAYYIQEKNILPIMFEIIE